LAVKWPKATAQAESIETRNEATPFEHTAWRDRSRRRLIAPLTICPLNWQEVPQAALIPMAYF